MTDSNVKGIMFNNGVQGIAKFKEKNEEGNYLVENFLIFEVSMEQGNQTLRFGIPTPFAEADKGISAEIYPTAILCLFEISKDILQSYYTATGTIQIVPASIISSK